MVLLFQFTIDFDSDDILLFIQKLLASPISKDVFDTKGFMWQHSEFHPKYNWFSSWKVLI